MTSLTMSPGVRTRLSIMMFLQYAFQGIWIIPLGAYLSSVGYKAGEIGSMYGTVALGFIIAPFFVGMIADRFFSAQKVLGVLNIAAAVLLYLASQMAVAADGRPQPGVLFWILLAHCICYTPSWALTNTIALNQMSNAGKQFPAVRVMGTIGWIAVSTITLFSVQIMNALGSSASFERSSIPMLIGAGIGLFAGLFSFILPATPPKKTDHAPTFGDILGIKALVLFKDRNFLVFALSSFLILFPGMFYWAFCNQFLNELGMPVAQFKQSIGQMAELVFLFIMPWFFLRFGVKAMLAVGMVAWICRFFCFSFGDLSTMVILLYLGLAFHGVCFDFFFVTGQLYTDKKAPAEVRASAQGLLSLITFGLGWFIGANLAGMVLDQHATLQLKPADMLNVQAFSQDLQQGAAQGEATPAGRLLSLLDQDARQAVAESAKEPSAERTARIVNGLNALQQRKDFYQPESFKTLALSERIDEDAQLKELKSEFAKAGPLEAKKIEEFNRLLLEKISAHKVSANESQMTIAPRRHDWKPVWIYPAGMAGVVLVLFLIGFKDKMRVGHEDATKEDAGAEAVAQN